jgi:CBS domain-containing protein
MTTGVFALLPDDDLSELRTLMAGWQVRHAPVVDESGAVLGVVSQRDLLRKTLLGREGAEEADVEEDLRRRRAAEVMSSNLELARPEDDAAEAGRRMLESKVGCLLVADERQRLQGILTESDYVRYLTAGGGRRRRARRRGRG